MRSLEWCRFLATENITMEPSAEKPFERPKGHKVKSRIAVVVAVLLLGFWWYWPRELPSALDALDSKSAKIETPALSSSPAQPAGIVLPPNTTTSGESLLPVFFDFQDVNALPSRMSVDIRYLGMDSIRGVSIHAPIEVIRDGKIVKVPQVSRRNASGEPVERWSESHQVIADRDNPTVWIPPPGRVPCRILVSLAEAEGQKAVIVRGELGLRAIGAQTSEEIARSARETDDNEAVSWYRVMRWLKGFTDAEQKEDRVMGKATRASVAIGADTDWHVDSPVVVPLRAHTRLRLMLVTEDGEPVTEWGGDFSVNWASADGEWRMQPQVASIKAPQSQPDGRPVENETLAREFPIVEVPLNRMVRIAARSGNASKWCDIVDSDRTLTFSEPGVHEVRFVLKESACTWLSVRSHDGHPVSNALILGAEGPSGLVRKSRERIWSFGLMYEAGLYRVFGRTDVPWLSVTIRPSTAGLSNRIYAESVVAFQKATRDNPLDVVLLPVRGEGVIQGRLRIENSDWIAYGNRPIKIIARDADGMVVAKTETIFATNGGEFRAGPLNALVPARPVTVEVVPPTWMTIEPKGLPWHGPEDFLEFEARLPGVCTFVVNGKGDLPLDTYVAIRRIDPTRFSEIDNTTAYSRPAGRLGMQDFENLNEVKFALAPGAYRARAITPDGRFAEATALVAAEGLTVQLNVEPLKFASLRIVCRDALDNAHVTFFDDLLVMDQLVSLWSERFQKISSHRAPLSIEELKSVMQRQRESTPLGMDSRTITVGGAFMYSGLVGSEIELPIEKVGRWYAWLHGRGLYQVQVEPGAEIVELKRSSADGRIEGRLENVPEGQVKRVRLQPILAEGQGRSWSAQPGVPVESGTGRFVIDPIPAGEYYLILPSRSGPAGPGTAPQRRIKVSSGETKHVVLRYESEKTD